MTATGLPPEALDRLAAVKVGLRSDLEVTRQIGAGGGGTRGIHYVVHDPVQFSNHLFDEQEYRVLAAIDERRSLREVFERLVQEGVLDADRQQEFFEFVLLQHQRNLIRLPIADGHRAWQNAKRRREQERSLSPLRRLMYWRIPVWNPDRFLPAAMPFVGWLFGRTGLAVWAVLMVSAMWAAGDGFWSLLFDAPALLEAGNLPLMVATLVGLKIIHELGHAFTCRRQGGAVPEMGLAFILGAPCAYVDASSAWRFEKPSRRIAVSMGGMYAESFVAAIALLVWSGTDSEFLRMAAHNVIVLATAITVLFNINPLMRFDGYYVLSDLVREPNLRPRSDQELKRLGRWLLGLAVPPRSSRPALHTTYGVAALIYKVVLAFTIVSLVMFEWPVVGTALGIAFAWMLIVQPIVTAVRWLWASDDTRSIRWRARAAALGLSVVGPVVCGTLIPIGGAVEVSGVVVATAGERVLHAPWAGFVRAVHHRPGDHASQGQVLIELESPELERQILRARAELAAARAELAAVEGIDPGATAAAAAVVTQRAATVDELDGRLDRRRVTAPFAGTVASVEAALIGTYVHAGDPLVTFVGEQQHVEAWIPARDLDRDAIASNATTRLRFARIPEAEASGTVMSIDEHAGHDAVPGPLTSEAGGPIRTVVRDGSRRAAQAHFRIRIQPDERPPQPAVGSTVRVVIGGTRTESLASWLSRRALGVAQQWQIRGAR